MQSRSSIQNTDSPPLPKAALDAATNSFVELGFNQKAIVEDYRFSSTKNNVVKMNALVFAHPSQRDLDEYASVTMFNAVNGHNDTAIIKLLAESSAPFHLIHREDRFSFWASGVHIDEKKRNKATIEPIQIEKSIAYKQLGEVLHAYSGDLHPQHIISVKQGRDVFKLFPQVNPLQLSLWAEEIRTKPLVRYFEQTINILRDHPTQLSNDQVTSIATQLLGLLILADTGVLSEEIRRDRPLLPVLITEAHKRFPHFFDESFLLTTHSDVVEQAYDMLQRVQYAGFVPDMLGDLYAVAYESDIRKHLGNYDTPLYITRRILDAIPVEYLPLHERVIADVTCGWGSFLIAGHERLSNLDDSKEIPLQHSLYGNDFDVFFTQLTKLGLLHTTSKDNWAISNADVFQWQWLKDNQPNIIVGNPPFEGNRKQSAKTEQNDEITNNVRNEEEQGRTEKANKFLEYMIRRLKPGGYLALIMPRSFAISEAGQNTRKKLLEACDILELWDLPTQVFKGATQRTTVIFVRKMLEIDNSKDVPLNTCVRTRTVQPTTLQSFKDRGIYTASSLLFDQSSWYTTEWKNESGQDIRHIIDYTIIFTESEWHHIRSHCIDLHYCAERTRGIARGTKRKDRKIQSKRIDLLPDVRHVMPDSYIIDYTKAQEAIYPNDFERPRLEYESLLKGQKVLLQYVQTPSWGKRVKLALERRGYYVSEHFWAIAPGNTNTLWLSYTLTNEILAAILGWHVSNAWIIEHMKSPAISSHTIDTIPIPTVLSQSDCTNLTKAILMLEKEAQAGSFISQLTLEAQEMINTILKAAYRLEEDTFERLRMVMEWESKSYITLDAQPNLLQTNWFTNGIVDSVEADKGMITFWLNGFDELQSVRIMPSMPGWMLRPGAAFLTRFPREYRRQRKIDLGNINWSPFQPQPYMYMDQEELLIAFSKNFATKSK